MGSASPWKERERICEHLKTTMLSFIQLVTTFQSESPCVCILFLSSKVSGQFLELRGRYISAAICWTKIILLFISTCSPTSAPIHVCVSVQGDMQLVWEHRKCCLRARSPCKHSQKPHCRDDPKSHSCLYISKELYSD